ncbi:MAG: efflux RND transporter periplasmic adaptor subunit [Chitinophagales bacterium]
MKKVFFILLAIFLVLGMAWLIQFYMDKNATPETVFSTTQLERKSIYKNTLATGNIKPMKEVKVKSAVSGILEELYFGSGDVVKKGDIIAKVKIIPNAENLTRAKEAIKKAALNLENSRLELNRNKVLFEKGVIAQQELAGFQFDYDLRLQELNEAELSLEVIQNGAVQNSGEVQNLIRATISGTILELGALVGDNIIESNTFNEGTTIVSIADLSNVYFAGTVDESEVGKLKEGMPVKISVGALDNIEIDGELSFIAPKGIEEEGTVKFSIQASITIPENTNLRAGYSANAEIIIEKRENVWSINEGNLIFEGDSSFVEVQIADNVYEKKYVKTGLSDGLFVEILEGIDSTANIKVLNSGTN